MNVQQLRMATAPTTDGHTPRIVRRPDGGLALHVEGKQVRGANVLAVGPSESGRVVASVVIDMSQATFGEANAPHPT